MSRLHLIEIHEQAWCPKIIRDGITGILQFISGALPAYEGVMPDFIRALQATNQNFIVDLCSGSGGPWRKLIPLLKDHVQQITLTDLHPNVDTFDYLQQNTNDLIHFEKDSVDASRVPESLEGFRTIFAAFHHFEPETAKAVLQNAVNQQQGIAIFELTERNPLVMFFIIVSSTLFSFAGVPFIRPFRWEYLLFTYVIPIIPLVLTIDGLISCLRTYSTAQLEDLVAGLDAPDYKWHVGRYQGATSPLPVTYLIGYPQEETLAE